MIGDFDLEAYREKLRSEADGMTNAELANILFDEIGTALGFAETNGGVFWECGHKLRCALYEAAHRLRGMARS